jgi:3-phenylpropionate/cinnamic acid dioxygenase small subunit
MTTHPSVFPHCDPLVLVGAGIHHDIQQFLFREALLLDHERYEDWIALLAADVRYRTPVSFARAIGIEPPTGTDYFEDDCRSLIARIRGLQNQRGPTVSARSSVAQARMRRLITNIIVSPRGRDEYDVLSYVLITHSGSKEDSNWFLSAERYDRVRCAARSFKIFYREIVVDQRSATVGAIDAFL